MVFGLLVGLFIDFRSIEGDKLVLNVPIEKAFSLLDGLLIELGS
jgi:hypothetical protein